jgi:VWFA-related protein
MVIGFNQRVHVAGAATNDPKKLKDDMHRLSVGGETAVYDAVRVAAQQLSKIHDNQPTRRAIILISDGEDNRSHIGLEDAISAALHADAVVYVLTTNPELSISLAQQGDHDMRQLAENTGGRLLRAGEDDDVKGAFNKLAQELRSQYAMGCSIT